jgi:glycerol-3-phosphate acyltransferase PlsY
MIVWVLVFVSAYLLGSIPSAVWVGKIFYKTDVREHGSGNAGSTNTFRVLGFKPGLAVFLIDVAKGFAAVKLSEFLPIEHSGEIWEMVKIGLGAAAVVGHIFPVFARFHGGKGVAAMLGIVFGIHIWAALAAFGLWILIFTVTRIVSASSIIAGFFFPISLLLIFNEKSVALLIFSIVTAILLIITHKKNIKRLIDGTEPKFKKNVKM